MYILDNNVSTTTSMKFKNYYLFILIRYRKNTNFEETISFIR